MGGTSTNPKPFGKGIVWFLLMVVGGVLVCAAGILAAPQSSRQAHRPQSCEFLVNNEDLPTYASYINFDDLSDGTFLTNQYQAVYGVVFVTSSKSYPNIHADEAMANSVPNYVDNYAGGDFSNNVPMTITFDTPQEYVALYFGHGAAGLIGDLITYDAGGNVLCLADLDPIPESVYGFVGIRNPEGEIAYLTIDYGDTSYSEAIDDLYFAPLVTDTPTPTPTAIITNTPTRTRTATARARAPQPPHAHALRRPPQFSPTPQHRPGNMTPPIRPRPPALLHQPARWRSRVTRASLNQGSSAIITWEVSGNTYFSTETYLVYDWTSHAAEDPYLYYQNPLSQLRPKPISSGRPRIERRNPVRPARPAIPGEVKGDEPQRCLGNYEASITVNYVPPPPTPANVSLTGITYSRSDGQSDVLKNVEVALCVGTNSRHPTSNNLGEYTFSALPGNYTLVGRKTGYHETRSAIKIKEGTSPTVNLYLDFIPVPSPTPVGGTYNGQVPTVGSHLPMPGARIDLHPSPGYPAEGLTYTAVATSDASGNLLHATSPQVTICTSASHIDYFMWFNTFQVTEGGTASGYGGAAPAHRPRRGNPARESDLTRQPYAGHPGDAAPG